MKKEETDDRFSAELRGWLNRFGGRSINDLMFEDDGRAYITLFTPENADRFEKIYVPEIFPLKTHRIVRRTPRKPKQEGT